MQFNFFLITILLWYAKFKLNSKKQQPQLDRKINFLVYGCIGILILEGSFSKIVPYTFWLAQVLYISLIYLSLTKKQLQLTKPITYSALPLFIVNLIEYIIEHTSLQLYTDWEEYIDMANLFAVIWLGILLFIDNRQRKSLEKARIIAAEKEKELQLTTKLKAELEVQVAERTAEIHQQKEALQKIVDELKSTQNQLVQQEKLASLGALTAGIAHEIKNPLNFVNNFSELSNELIKEFKISKSEGERNEILADLEINLQKINEHGKRADSIVKNMLQHSRSGSGEKQLSDINQICEEYFNLAFHGKRATDANFNCEIVKNLDANLPRVNCVVQDISRVILNLINNAFDAVREREIEGKTPNYKPTVTLSTQQINNIISISIHDNGKGIPQHIQEKIFEPFFTTKPAGQGTGLGLSLSYDIVKAQGGEMKLETVEGEGSEFLILLPL